jgi:hypothetical protein
VAALKKPSQLLRGQALAPSGASAVICRRGHDDLSAKARRAAAHASDRAHGDAISVVNRQTLGDINKTTATMALALAVGAAAQEEQRKVSDQTARRNSAS